MVYSMNIVEQHKRLNDEEKLVLCFDKDNLISIFKDDVLEKADGDLRIIREDKLCEFIVDTAFVKYFKKVERFL